MIRLVVQLVEPPGRTGRYAATNADVGELVRAWEAEAWTVTRTEPSPGVREWWATKPDAP